MIKSSNLREATLKVLLLETCSDQTSLVGRSTDGMVLVLGEERLLRFVQDACVPEPR